jgi:hypothetical protein
MIVSMRFAYCDSCLTTFEQYKYIASGVIPAMAASARRRTREPAQRISD